jgi:SAM-dependent methyltransferase
VAARVSFECADFVREYEAPGLSDLAFSHNALEHIASPLACLRKIGDCLAPGGFFSAIFGPLWWSPYGAHLWGFTPVPWVHFLFPEKMVLRVRTERYRPDDPVERYEDVRGSLNRLTVKMFQRDVARAGLIMEVMRLNPHLDGGIFKWANALVNLTPILRELGSFQLLAVLRRPG